MDRISAFMKRSKKKDHRGRKDLLRWSFFTVRTNFAQRASVFIAMVF